MKVSNYNLCSFGNKEEKILNQDKKTKLRLPFKEGLTLEIKRLSLPRSLEGEEQEERILQSSRDVVWPVSERCAKILDRVEIAEIWSKKWRKKITEPPSLNT